MSNFKYTEKEFREAVASSCSISETMKKLGLTYTGQAYRTFKRRAIEWSVDYSHFTGKGWSKGKKLGSRRSIKSHLILNNPNSSFIGSYALKMRLYNEGLKQEQCEICGLGNQWNKQTLSLHLDHINGKSWDNRLENLRILCPNCHSQTNTYAGKNRRSPRTRTENHDILSIAALPISVVTPKTCVDCLCSISPAASRCKSCAAKRRPTRIDWPDHDELLRMVKESSYLETARRLGVSDNAIRKRLRNH